VVEELMAAARRAANKGRGGVRPTGKVGSFSGCGCDHRG
jgi:hypothetical protein